MQGVGLLGCFALSCFPFGSFWLFLSFCLGFSFDRILFGSVFGLFSGFLFLFAMFATFVLSPELVGLYCVLKSFALKPFDIILLYFYLSKKN